MWQTGQTVESLHPVLCTCLLMENIDKNFFLCEKCQNTCSCAAWFRLIVHWAWWPLMTGAITQPDERLSWRGPETGQTDRARGHLQVEKFCSVPPVAGMKPSGPSEHHYWRMVGGPTTSGFCSRCSWSVFCHTGVKWGKHLTQQR